MKKLPRKAILKNLRQRASKGGKAGTGSAKARSSEQARAAAKARWAKRRAARGISDPGDV